jgi:hypothetical protein
MSTVTQPPEGGQALPSSSSSSPVLFPTPPQLAIRSDLVVLLSVEEMGDRDLTGRTLWVAVVLTDEESALLRSRASNVEQETASWIIGRLPRKQKNDP